MLSKNFVRGAFWIKPFIVFVLLLLLLIPLSFINDLTYSRSATKEMAQSSILTPVGGELRLQGLVIAVPYAQIIEVIDEKTNKLAKKIIKKNLIIAPKNYSLSAQIDPTYLRRGIFRVPIFSGEFTLRADFEAINYAEFGIDPALLDFNETALVLGIGDQKSLSAFPELSLNGAKLKAYHGKKEIKIFERNLIYKLPNSALSSNFSVSGALKIQGGSAVHLVPIAQNSHFDVNSSWASPSFGGGFIAKSREVDESGFRASWEITGLAANVGPAWLANQDAQISGNYAENGAMGNGAMDGYVANDYPTNDYVTNDYVANGAGNSYENYEISNPKNVVSIDFIEPVNNYSLIKRCTDYALLFLAVPFLAIFLCEIYTRERIHPIQYLLIGLEDVVFYLLTLSLSEHTGFAVSYAVSALAVSATIFFYASAIFRGKRWGTFITCVQLVSYAILYVILNSQDYALLMGSLMIFVVISLVMYLTRKLNWYDTALPNGEKR